jgi:hypothetical protein
MDAKAFGALALAILLVGCAGQPKEGVIGQAVDEGAAKLGGSEGGRADWERTWPPKPATAAAPAKPAAATTGTSNAAIPPVTQSAPSAPASTPAPATAGAPAAAQALRYRGYAEQFAKGSGCERPVAALNYANADSETYSVVCSNAPPRTVRCDSGDCRELK